MSTAAALPVLAPILKAAAETRSAEDPVAFPDAASRGFRAHFPMLKESVNGHLWCISTEPPRPNVRVRWSTLFRRSTCTTMRIQQNLYTRWPAVLPRRTTLRERRSLGL